MTDTTTPLYRDPDAPVDTRVRDLLARMTLRVKVGQLNQRMYGWEAYRRTPEGFELTDALRAETARFAGLGALYGLFRADAWSGVDHSNGPGAQDSAALAELVQRHVIDSSRLGIPALFVEEVPHGHMALDGTAACSAVTASPPVRRPPCRRRIRARRPSRAASTTPAPPPNRPPRSRTPAPRPRPP